MSTPDLAHHVYRFDEFTLDIERGAVLRSGEEVRLRPKAFEVLRYLVEHHGQLVGKDELLDAVWSPAVVTEDSVTQCLMEIRRAINDDDQTLIRTVPRRGYIFNGAVLGPLALAEPATAGQAEAQIAKPPARPHARRAALLALLATVLLGLWWRSDREGKDASVPSAAPAQSASIAVLPFADMSPAGDQAWFADGISEEILNRLARVPGLRVIARTSSFSFKGSQADIGEIAEKLNVDHVLEGSVRRAGDDVRITAQLIRTDDSSHLWSQTFDRRLEDALQVQDEISAAVAAALEKSLVVPVRRGAAARIDPQAYEAYLQGRFYFNRRGEGDIARALRHFGQAVRLDPGFARAWAGLAGAWRIHAFEPGADQATALAQLKATAERAIALDPTLAEAHIRLAHYYVGTYQREQAELIFAKAFALDPEDPFILSIRASEAERAQNIDAALKLQRRAVASDPLSAVYRNTLAHYLIRTGRLVEARAEIDRAMQLFPSTRGDLEEALMTVLLLQANFEEALTLARTRPSGGSRDRALAMIHGRMGEHSASRAAMARLEAGKDVRSAIALAEVHGFLGNPDAAIDWLVVARSRTRPPRQDRDAWQRLYETRNSPFLAEARTKPRWEREWQAGMARWNALRQEGQISSQNPPGTGKPDQP